MAAVVVVNIVIAIYVYLAWRESINDEVTGADKMQTQGGQHQEQAQDGDRKKR